MLDILGIGYDFRIKLAFNFLKSDTIRTVPFGLGMINVGLTQALHDYFPVCSLLPYAVSPCTEYLYVCKVQVKAYYVLVQYLP